MKKLAIFDLDGTLLNTIEDLGRATNYALKNCGYPEQDLTEYNMFVGRGIYNLFRNAMPKDKINDENVEKMASFFIPYYDEHMCDFTKPYDGIMDLLKKLNAKGIKIGIATNKYQKGAERIVKHYFSDIKLVKVLGQEEGRPIKPDPKIIEFLMKEVNKNMEIEHLNSNKNSSLDESLYSKIDKKDVIYIGDSDVDMMTGKNAEITTVGVTWGFRSREELKSYSPDAIADNAQMLEQLILQ